MTKLKDSLKTIDIIIQLIKEVRPDQAQNFSNADKFIKKHFLSQFGEEDADTILDSIERNLAYCEGNIVVGTLFSWVKKGLLRAKMINEKQNSPDKTSYYGN